MNPQTEFKYWAFISYSHQDNRKGRNLWGDWLHDAVEHFKVPQELVGKPGRYGELVPERLFPAFQDEKELPTNADLGAAIREALQQSRYLVVICSPRAARSVYVNEEVLEFKRLGRADRILAIIVDGEPNASEPGKGFDPALECFPPALRHPLGSDGNPDLAQRVEPIAADVRGTDGREVSRKDKAHRHMLEREKLRVVAGLLGIGFDDLVQRDKERQLAEERAKARRLRKLVAGFAALALVATVAGVAAVIERRQAETRKEEALQTLSQSDFLQAQRLITEDKKIDSLAYLARSLSANPTNDAALTRLATLLTYQSWALATLILKHGGAVGSAEFSPDGKRIVTASIDNTARVWDAQTGQPLTEPMTQEFLDSAQFSPDGKRILTVSWWDNTARVWDAQTGQPLAAALKHNGEVNSAQFSPDGKRIVTASGSTARVWDAQTGQPLMEPLKHNGPVYSAQFSPDGKRIFTASKDGTARVWDAQSGQPLTEPLIHDGNVCSAQFSPDGKRILTTSRDDTTRVWDAQSGQPLTEPLKHNGSVRSAQFSRDGKRIVTASEDTARVWDAQSGQPLMEALKHNGAVNSAQFSPDGKRILTASKDGTARVWDAQSGQPLTEPLRHNGAVNSAQFSPDGKRILTASKDGTARVWDAQSGQPLTEPLKHNGQVWSAQFSRDGKRIVTASDDKTARVWDAQSGQPLMEPLKHNGAVFSAQFSPDGKRIVTACWVDNTARVWDAQSGQPLTEPLRHNMVRSAQFSPDGKRIVTASDDSHPNGKRLVTASDDKTARVWDAQSGQLLTEVLRHNGAVNSAQFSPDGKRILTASDDNTARVWDTQSGQPLTEALKHNGEVNSAQFSPDGKRILTASKDGTARVWDAQSGQPLTEPLIHDGNVCSAQFSPDGKWIVTACWGDNTARVWDVASCQPGPPGWLLQLSEAISGHGLNKQGVLEQTRLSRAETIKQIREQLRHESGDDDWVVWGRWFLADPSTRTISPFSKITVPQYIENRIKENTAESLAEGERLAYGNTSLLQRIAQAQEKLERTKGPKPAT